MGIKSELLAVRHSEKWMSGVQSIWCYLQIELSGAFIDELKADEVTASSSGTHIMARSRRYAADWMNVGYVVASLV